VLSISATDAISACVGIHRYLRTACNASVGWDAVLPLNIPSFPDVAETRGSARLAEAYYLNFCTFSYTTPYWDWGDWEREIDWMALHGITMPLMVVGHEAVLHAAYTELGLESEKILEFLGGPGYLPFQYMGCLDSFAGRPTRSWVDRHAELGTRILSRQREFGMTPVLPTFSGHVPEAIAPDRVSHRDWQGFSTAFLDPTDPLYRRIGTEVTRAQIALFGTDHLYAADPFIEMLPVDADPAYPGVVAEALLAGLRSADPDAVWVMQSWPFVHHHGFWTDERVTAFLEAIPDDGLLILDLWAETDPQWRRFDRFAGKRWIWCALLNFGGRTDLVGEPHRIQQELEEAMVPGHPPTGIGLAMEATRNNPALYELATDLAWSPPAEVTSWLDDFVDQRYRRRHPDLREGWQDLLATVYGGVGMNIFPEVFRGILTEKPSYSPLADLPALREKLGSTLWYDHDRLIHGWGLLLTAAEEDDELAAGPLGHDLADVGLSALLRVADRYYLDLVEHSLDGGTGSEHLIARFLRLFDDLDRMLATRSEFTLRAWETKARPWGDSPAERDALVDNARRILTVWNEPAISTLDDYAGRIWAGLVGGYYRERWSIWADGLARALTQPAGVGERELDDRIEQHAHRFLRIGAGSDAPSGLGIAAESRALFKRYSTEPVVSPAIIDGFGRGTE
jgi:alpha-N-acetylglucosaminidase